MGKKVVQITFTEAEINQITPKADELGLDLPMYIKQTVLGDSEFQKRLKELIEKTSNIPSGTRYNIKMVFGIEWLNIDKSVRLALGRSFNSQVKSGKISNAIEDKKDSANTQWYIAQ